MTNRLGALRTETCVWMDAGLLTYKLCDRHFDCEHCPLDAALRGAARRSDDRPPANSVAARHARILFPTDRLYSDGHTWVQSLEQRPERLRFGLDGFATSLMSSPRGIRWNGASHLLRRGETICMVEFDEGVVTLGTPVAARLGGRNLALEDDPCAIIAEPYGDGWIVDMVQVAQDELAQLLSAEAAQERARLDLRRLRRYIALHLLADGHEPTSSLGDGGELADGLHILGGAGYLDGVRQVVH